MHLLNDLYLTHQMRDLYQSLHDLFDVLVDIDDLGDYPIDDLDGRRREDDLRFFLVFVYLRDFLDEGH